jgi:uncharacterized protein YjbI with pentapeptide repeats
MLAIRNQALALMAIMACQAYGQEVYKETLKDFDISGQRLEAQVCERASFTNGQAVGTVFSFSRVMRFCNFSNVIADEAIFQGPLYQQYFFDSSLRGAKFYLSLTETRQPSRINFVNTDLTGAEFYGNTSELNFKNTKVDGVLINGTPCQYVLEACKVPTAEATELEETKEIEGPSASGQ